MTHEPKPGPITPQETRASDCDRFPPQVWEAFNYLIKQYWDGRGATVPAKHAFAEVAARLGTTTGDVEKRRLLDVEDVYRRAGWTVEYDSPDWNEPGESFFKFMPRKPDAPAPSV